MPTASAARRDLPIPASPVTKRTPPRLSRASLNAWSRTRSSASRPTTSGRWELTVGDANSIPWAWPQVPGPGPETPDEGRKRRFVSQHVDEGDVVEGRDGVGAA